MRRLSAILEQNRAGEIERQTDQCMAMDYLMFRFSFVRNVIS